MLDGQQIPESGLSESTSEIFCGLWIIMPFPTGYVAKIWLPLHKLLPLVYNT